MPSSISTTKITKKARERKVPRKKNGFLTVEEEREKIFAFGQNVPPVFDKLPEPKLTPTGEYVARNNYLKRDSKGQIIETTKELFWRVAHNISTADLLYKATNEEMDKTRRDFYDMLSNLEFIPNTPTLANAACSLQQLSACFVLPVEDNLDAIGKAFWQTMLIHKTGGGTGFSFSKLRPFGSIVRSTGRQSSGAIYFMWMYADATDRIQQGGYRRGANMGVMRVNHPDILRWITVKSAESIINSFNLSVAITDEFMRKVEEDSRFAPNGLKDQGEEVDKVIKGIQNVLRNPDQTFGDKVMAFEKEIVKLKALVEAKDPEEGFELINPDTNMVESKLNARKMFELIARIAWEKGDPGVIFIDRINGDNPTPHLGKIEATNPCGEQPLLPYESCNLGAVNLTVMAKKDASGNSVVDYEKLEKVVMKAVHFLDNVIDMNHYPLEEIAQMTRGNRKIGLGVMGWAGMLVQLGIPYNSPIACHLAEELMGFIRDKARSASMELAKKRGVFPNFKGSIYDPESPYFKGKALFLRNAAITTIAPTGTTSMLADVNSGIEPFFALYYKKNIVNGDQVETLNPHFVQVAKERGFWTEDLVEKIKNNKGSVKNLPEVPEDIQHLFPVASDISSEDHILVQAAFQRGGVDNAISKTINMPYSATVDDVIRAYRLSYQEGCKGVTIYRDQSRKKQILVTGHKEAEQGAKEAVVDQALKPRPIKVDGATYKIATPLGNAFITVNHDASGNPFEVFIIIGKAGSEVAAMAEGLGRMISATLRFGNHQPPLERAKEIIGQLSGIGGGRSVGFGPNKVRSLPDAVAKALRMHFGLIEHPSVAKPAETPLPEVTNEEVRAVEVEEMQVPLFGQHKDFCPGCGGATLVYEEGCKKCHTCGYSEC
ncbi:MAG: adenosylcobalamin-dependent ribonucleoside-diphosphate reductase [bacterium]|nr:adenosylcobalamin-dependent ribonucleoside-diphosphate reductase [bacterium]